MRANSLRSQGLAVYEFGNRALREGCFGEDVLQLQNWLAEESYYNPVDGGYTGYFGSVTKEALQAWQRDAEIEVTGVFDGPTKWAYLKSVENRAKEQQSASKRLAVGIEPSTNTAVTPKATLQANLNKGPSDFSSLFAVGVALVVLAATGIVRRTITGNRRSATKLPMVQKLEHVPPESTPPPQVKPSPNTSRKTPAPQVVANPKKIQKRLSDDELQRYIAPMKGSTSGRSPVQRPAPRPLVLGEGSKGVNLPEDAVVSRHGMYYGGKQVLDRVKQFLAEENGDSAPIGSAAQRLMQLGYDMRNGMIRSQKKEEPKKINGLRSTPSNPPSQPAQQNLAPSRSASFEDIPDESSRHDESNSVENMTDNGTGPLSDMRSSQSTTLLAGTELETAPERGIRPVQVQRGKSVRSPLGGASANGRRNTNPPPKQIKQPVPVVKPNDASSTDTDQLWNGVEGKDPLDPNATVVLSSKPVKLHKPARLASQQYDNSDDE